MKGGWGLTKDYVRLREEGWMLKVIYYDYGWGGLFKKLSEEIITRTRNQCQLQYNKHKLHINLVIFFLDSLQSFYDL